MTPSSSAMDWFVEHLNSCMRFIMLLFWVHVSLLYVAVGNMHVRIIRNFILLCAAFHSFSMSTWRNYGEQHITK